MNRYRVRFESSDQRVWEVTIQADGMTDDGFLVRFWRRWGPFGWFRSMAHYISAEMLISVIGDSDND